MTKAEAEAVGEAIGAAVKKAIAPLTARVAALEARPVGLSFRGAWAGDQTYAANDGVVHDGSTWVARMANQGVRPGDGLNWQLCAKRGRDGRDGKDAR